MKSAVVKATLLGIAIAGATACRSTSHDSDDEGSAGIRLILPDDSTIDTVDWRIAG